MNPAQRRARSLGSGAVVLAALAGCVTAAEEVHWDARSRLGVARTPIRGANDYRTRLQAARIMQERCEGDGIAIVDEGTASELADPYRSWDEAAREVESGSRDRYYWVYACVAQAATVRDACVPKAPPRMADAGGAGDWLHLAAPATGERARAPVIEVRGAARGRGARGQDLVLVLDLSDSTLAHSGFDVDGDGASGTTSAELAALLAAQPGMDRAVLQRARESDFDDSIVMAVLTAARALLDRLDLEEHRVALVAFSTDATLLAPLGSPRAVLEGTLRELRVGFARYLRSTDAAGALRLAVTALGPRGERDRSVVLLSDGRPTIPNEPDPETRGAALILAGAGIRLYGYVLGAPTAVELVAYRENAECTGGSIEKLELPGDVIVALREIDLADLAEVRAVNRTTQATARALRVFPAGDFDGFVDLAPGPNTIEVEAVLADGRRASVRREVHYDPADLAPEEIDRLHGLLQRRSLEIALWDEMRRTRRRQEKVLELEVEKPTPAVPGP